MQQLFSAFGLDFHLLIIQMVNFGVLLAALTYFLYTPILRIIDERREKIAEGVRAAEEAQRQLQDAKSEGDQMIATASKDAESLVAQARTRANEKGLEIVQNAEQKADMVLKDAAARAEEARRSALKENEKEIARTALLAAEKILREAKA